MNIELNRTSKKLTKVTIKQMEVANWETIELQFKENPSTEFFKINDVFKFSIVIFKGFDDEWYYFPLHKYTITPKGDDVYQNGGKHLWINNKNKSELFLENVDLIQTRMIKTFI
jgi:hypothetical protein